MSKTCRIDITLVGLCCSKTQGDLPDWGHAVQTEILDILYHTLFGVKYVWLKIVVDHKPNPAPTWDSWKICQYQHTEYVRVFIQLNHIFTISLGAYWTWSMSTNRKGYGLAKFEYINLNASAAFGAIRKLGHGALAEMCGCLLWQYCAGLVFFYKFIWSTDDSSWVVACSCCRVFSIKCGFNIIIIYMFSFLVEWWISTLVVASDLLLLVVYLLHPCMGRALPSWAEKHL